MAPAESSQSRPLRLGVLISGTGTTLANLIERIRDGRLAGVEIRVVVSTRPEVRGVLIARDANLPVHVIRPQRGAAVAAAGGADAFSAAITNVLDEAGVDLVLMGGFLSLWRFPVRYRNRVLNVHPALLPRFGGPGMYGLRVHEAVFAAGENTSGCTVHLADHEYDHGPIVAQRQVPVLPGDTPETLAARVALAERELYPEVVQHVVDEGLTWLEQFSRAAGVRRESPLAGGCDSR